MVGIYKITNKTTGECYIGQSENIKKRWSRHRATSRNPKDHNYNLRLYKDMRLYGFDNFEFSVVEECDAEDLLDKEIYWISFYDSYINGYNMTMGGKSGVPQKLLNAKLLEIIELLKNSELTNIEIAKMYGVDDNMIGGINTGHYWKMKDVPYPIRERRQKKVWTCEICGDEISKGSKLCLECYRMSERKVCRPDKETLEKILKNNKSGFSGVAKQFGVSDNAVRKWCKSYGLPTKSNAYK